MTSNRLTLVAGVAALLIGTSSCTAQQVADVVEAYKASTGQPTTPAPAPTIAPALEPAPAITPVVAVDGPHVTASVDCTTFNVEVGGYPAGTNVMVGVGSQPPYGFKVGGDVTWQFTPIPGGGKAALPIGAHTWEATHSFHAIVEVGYVYVYDQVVDCTPL